MGVLANLHIVRKGLVEIGPHLRPPAREIGKVLHFRAMRKYAYGFVLALVEPLNTGFVVTH